MSQPLRTCVGCRVRADQQDLLRVVVEEGQIVPDSARRRPGRGAYVHPIPECVNQAVDRRAFNRSFRAKVDVQRLIEALTPPATINAQNGA